MTEELLKKLHTAMCNDNEHQCNRLNNYIHTDEYLTAEVVQVVKEIIAEETKELQKANKELKRENDLAKSLLYCTERTCDNCGFVTCENFQRQRKSEPCALYVSYQDRIKNLEHKSDVLRESLECADIRRARKFGKG